MEYQNSEIKAAAQALKDKLATLPDKRAILRAPEMAALYERLKTLPAGEKRAVFGKEVNQLKSELEELVQAGLETSSANLTAIDVTAPFDINVSAEKRPKLLPVQNGSRHPLMAERDIMIDIFARMGFRAMEAREIDDEYHMFTSLNFPPDHPARDDYDTFKTTEGLIAPAHTTTMQNRALKMYKKQLEAGEPIAMVFPDRTFRNEDVDARHDHTFYQHDGMYVAENVNVGHLIATLKTFFKEYFQKDVKVKTQPFFFPFTEPSFEFSASCPFCDQKGCNVCSYSGWIELLGCGIIHPNVLKEGGIDPKKYSGFAWGGGIERLVMIKYGIEDVRHFESANLSFLRRFS